jgi:DNA-binding LacI/PurR family transcriptional regulator/DNA-binding transcriptional regulator YhcF (GntR family)
MMTNSVAKRRKREESAGATAPLLLLPRVNGSSPVPLYLQVRGILAESIRKGLLLPGGQVPSTVHIARQLRVSLLTAHRALQQLTEDGWLVRGRGQRTFVRADFQAALDHAPRFRIVIATNGNTASQDRGCAWGYLAGIQTAAAQIVPPTERIAQHYESPGELKHTKADGIICIQPRLEDIPALERISQDKPIVLVGAAPPVTGMCCIDAANQEGARSAVRHFAELGHERIALVINPADGAASQERLCGFMLEMGCRGLPICENRILSVACSSDEVLNERLVGLMQAKHRPTAVIAGDLRLSMSVRASLQRQRLDVPRQVSLIGFGDDWFTGMLSPPLTVVAQPVEDMARRAFSRLLQVLSAQPVEARTDILPTSLIIRGTTAPPPKPDRPKVRRAAPALV